LLSFWRFLDLSMLDFRSRLVLCSLLLRPTAWCSPSLGGQHLCLLRTLLYNPDSSVGAITCGINDLLIASCLGYELFKLKAQTSNSSVLHRVFILSITSGAIVATTTLLMMILFLKGNIAFDFFFSCQGRIYALTLLLNFLSGTSSTSGTTIGSKHQNGLSPMFSKSGGGSIRSNISDSSMNKELPPLPVTPGLHNATLNLSPQFASATYTSFSAGVIWTPQTPRTLRIVAPYRSDSLPH